MNRQGNLRQICLAGLLLALLTGFGPLAPPVRADTLRVIVVDNVDDDDPGGGCTLREAITLANFGQGPGTHPNGCTVTESGSGAPISYTINLPAYTYTLSGPSHEDNNWNGDLDVMANVSIIGAGADLTIIDGAARDRIFHIDPAGVDGFVVDLYGLTIRNGSVPTEGGGIHNGGNNTMNISNCAIADNEASAIGGVAGGGIYDNGGALNVTGSTITGNHTATNPGNMSRGGGIYTTHGSLTISGSTILSNTTYVTAGPGSHSQGGGIYSLLSTVIISDTAITGNETTNPYDDEYTGRGGGIYAASGTLSVADGSTISGNQTKDRGGGIYGIANTVTVSASTVSDNKAADGGGIYCFGLPGTGTSSVHAPLVGANITDGSIISNNEAQDQGGGIYNWYTSEVIVDGSTVSGNKATDGGGIYNQGLLTIQNHSLIGGGGAGNEAERYGGGIYNEFGTLTLNDSTVSGNTCKSHGGGVYNDGGIALLNDSEVSTNTSDKEGGGIISNGHSERATLMINKCTISGNTAHASDYVGGGGLYLSYSPASIANTTISGNRATHAHGGGIGTLSDDYLTIDLVHCTITDNRASGKGGGLQLESSYTTNISSTIVAGNSADGEGPDIAGTVNSQDYNLLQDTTDTTIEGTTTHNVTGQDPKLGPLANNGGDTPTHALLSGSPAIDAIPEASCPLPNDQRGIARPQRAGCDIGAYEAGMIRVFLPLILRDYD